MKTECSVVIDLLPLYVEDMLSEQSAKFVKEHLGSCPACMAELARLKCDSPLEPIEQTPKAKDDKSGPFKKIMKRMNRQFYSLSYSLIIFFIFLGFGWTAGDNLMYNSLIMPLVGVFGYFVFGWRSVYKMPVLLLIIDVFICLSKLINITLYSAFMWTIVYSLFVLVGIAIAFLLHYAFKKENNYED